MLGFYGIQTCLGFMGFVLRNVTVDFQDLSGIELRERGGERGTLGANVPRENWWIIPEQVKRFFFSGGRGHSGS